MKISDNLMLSISAMNSYNRGYNTGINSIGNNDPLGNAKVKILSSTEDGSPERAASFFAISYSWNGKTVVAYRGTDTEPLTTGPDSPAFLMGGGDYRTAQGNLAIDFYRSVNGGSATTNPDVIVTGHSLGGGLAGPVAANDDARPMRLWSAA